MKRNTTITTTTAAAVRVLLKKAPHALQDLHRFFGFDFMADFSAAVIQGPFTVRKAAAAVNPDGKAGAAIVAIHTPENEYCNSFRVVEITGPADFRIGPDMGDWYFRDFQEIGTFWRKADFQEMRKDPAAVAVVLFQVMENLKRPKEAAGIQPWTRYKVGKNPGTGLAAGGGRYVSSIEITPIDGIGRLSDHFRVWWHGTGYTAPATVADYIDRSGYVVFYRRQEWRRRAVALRRERERGEYIKKAPNHSAEIRRKLERLKCELSAAIMAANTEKDFSRIDNAIGYQLSYCVSRIQGYEKAAAERGFSSVAAEEKEAVAILDKIEEIREGI